MYPVVVPVTEIQLIIEIVRSGQISERSSELAHALWVVLGYAQGIIFGNPNITASMAVDIPTDEEVLSMLEKYVAEDTVSAQMAIPWQIIVKWAIDYLVKVIEDRLSI
jgi:hypothetical protein